MNQKQQSKCIAMISSGPRKGKECGNSLGGGKVFCGRHSKNDLGEECIICHESRVNERLDCGHIYHTHCIEKWFATCGNKKCPLWESIENGIVYSYAQNDKKSNDVHSFCTDYL